MIKTGWENQQLSNLFLFYRNYWNSVKKFLPLNGETSQFFFAVHRNILPSC